MQSLFQGTELQWDCILSATNRQKMRLSPASDVALSIEATNSIGISTMDDNRTQFSELSNRFRADTEQAITRGLQTSVNARREYMLLLESLIRWNLWLSTRIFKRKRSTAPF